MDNPCGRVVVTPDLSAALRRDLIRVSLLNPATIAFTLAMLGVIELLVNGAALPGGVPLAVRAVASVPPALVMAGGIVWRVSARVNRSLALAMPVGSVITAELTADGLRTTSPAGASTLAYRMLRGAEVRGSSLVLRHRVSRQRSLLPVALCGPEGVAELVRRIPA